MEENTYKPVVLVLAMQPGYLGRRDIQLEVPEDELVDRISNFLDSSRELGIPVYFSRIIESPYQGEILPELLRKKDKVIDAESANAFHKTNLDELLFGEGVEAIIPVGVYRGIAVHATARAAYDKGLDVLFAPDLSADPKHPKFENGFYEGMLASLYSMSKENFQNSDQLLNYLAELLPAKTLSSVSR